MEEGGEEEEEFTKFLSGLTSFTSSSESFPSPFLSHLELPSLLIPLREREREREREEERYLHVKENLKSGIKVSIGHVFPKLSQFFLRYPIFCVNLSASRQGIKQLPSEFLWIPHSYNQNLKPSLTIGFTYAKRKQWKSYTHSNNSIRMKSFTDTDSKFFFVELSLNCMLLEAFLDRLPCIPFLPCGCPIEKP